MTAITIASFLITAISFIVTIIKGIIPLIKSITELTTVVKQIKEDLECFQTRSSNSHKRLWEHNEQQDEKIDNHESRLIKIEAWKEMKEEQED
jgi:predicted PurR-regulated permease PerM